MQPTGDQELNLHLVLQQLDFGVTQIKKIMFNPGCWVPPRTSDALPLAVSGVRYFSEKWSLDPKKLELFCYVFEAVLG